LVSVGAEGLDCGGQDDGTGGEGCDGGGFDEMGAKRSHDRVISSRLLAVEENQQVGGSVPVRSVRSPPADPSGLGRREGPGETILGNDDLLMWLPA
jgi:hypothetical protein